MKEKYKIGFTRPALLREMVVLSQLFRDFGNWQETHDHVISNNVFQTRTNRSSEVLYGEMFKRLSLLSHEQIELLSEDYPFDVKHLVWISICKQYPFVRDFVIEAVSPALAVGRSVITLDDYRYFFNSKAEWHPELDQVSEKTRSNAQGAVFQMMRQCELLDESNKVIPQFISPALQNCSSQEELDLIPGAIPL